jgi:hypothetical protein
MVQEQRKDKDKEVLPIVNFGGAEGARTPYLRNANAALSQLSYSPMMNQILEQKWILTERFYIVKKGKSSSN